MKYIKPNYLLLLVVLSISMGSCISKKKHGALQDLMTMKESLLEERTTQLNDCVNSKKKMTTDYKIKDNNRENELSTRDIKIQMLEEDLSYTKSNNENLLSHLSSLSNLNQAESANLKQTLDALNDQRKYIKELNNDAQKKDSVNLALVTNLKRSLSDTNDSDISVEVRKGVVYVSISDKLLFSSGSTHINQRAQEVLGKVATVINDHKGIDIMVEGHTDTNPISTSKIKDNWDLSVMRATAVVRVLQNKYNVDPSRLTAAGRSEFVPKYGNDDQLGRSGNRRTEIVITPKLNQYFNLMK